MTFDRATIRDIQRAGETGIYDFFGWGAKRKLPHLDDLVFLGAFMSRYPLEGYRERSDTTSSSAPATPSTRCACPPR